MLTTLAFLIYITLSIGITVYVSRTLSKNGLPFLIDGFAGKTTLAESTNHLLVVGFYLINLGFVLLRMKTNVVINDVNELIVYQTSGLGLVLLILGAMHFFNMLAISRYVHGMQSRPDQDRNTESAETT